MAKANTHIPMGTSMMGSGKMVSNMELEFTNTREMEECELKSKANFFMIFRLRVL